MCYRWYSCCRLLLSRTHIKFESLIAIWRSDIKHINTSTLKKWLTHDRSLFFTQNPRQEFSIDGRLFFRWWFRNRGSFLLVASLSITHGFQGHSAHLYQAGKEKAWGSYFHDLEFSCSLFVGLGGRGPFGGHKAFFYRVYPSCSSNTNSSYTQNTHSFPKGNNTKFSSATVPSSNSRSCAVLSFFDVFRLRNLP